MSNATNVHAAHRYVLARQRMEMLSRLAAGTADEFGSVLQSVHGYVTIARETLPAGSEPREYLDSAIKAVVKANNLATRLLECNRALVVEWHEADNSDAISSTRLQALTDQRGSHLSQSLVASPKEAKPRTFNLLQQIEHSLVELTSLADDRLSSVFDSATAIPDPPRAIKDFIRRLAESEVLDLAKSSGSELAHEKLQATQRVTCYTTVIAVPVDRLRARVGDPFKLALRDVSEGGVRLLHTRATNAAYLALSWNATQLGGEQIRVFCNVKRCEACGPFYDIGGPFLMAD